MLNWKDSRWTSIDKLLHFIFGFFITSFFGLPLTLAAAIIKEIIDEYQLKRFDIKDIVATLAGGIIPLFLF